MYKINGYEVLSDSPHDGYIIQPNLVVVCPDTRICPEHDEVSRYIKNRFKRKTTPEELRDALNDWFSDETVEVNGFKVYNSDKYIYWKSPKLEGWIPNTLMSMENSSPTFHECKTTVHLKSLFVGKPKPRVAEVVQAIKEFQPKVTPMPKPTLKEFTDAIDAKIQHCGISRECIRQVLVNMWPEQVDKLLTNKWLAHYNWLIHNWNPPEKKVTFEVKTKVWATVNLLLDMQGTDAVLENNFSRIVELLVVNHTLSNSEADRLVKYAAYSRGFLIAKSVIIIFGIQYTYDQVELKLI